jgi:hypothetical protein
MDLSSLVLERKTLNYTKKLNNFLGHPSIQVNKGTNKEK